MFKTQTSVRVQSVLQPQLGSEFCSRVILSSGGAEFGFRSENLLGYKTWCMDSSYQTIDMCHLGSGCLWDDKFESIYSRRRGEGHSLSFPLDQERGESTPSQHSLDGHPPSHFLFDGRMAANNGDEYMTFATNEWCAALGARILSIRRIFTRVWCLASGAKTRVAGLLNNTFKNRFGVTWLLFWRIVD